MLEGLFGKIQSVFIKKNKVKDVAIYYSVGIYKNINDNSLILVPDGFDQHGLRRSVNKPVLLKEPYTTDVIGAKLKVCFETTVNHQYEARDMEVIVTELVTGEKHNKKFVKNHLFQWVFFNIEKGYEFEAKTKSNDSLGFTAIPNTNPLALNLKSTDRELGEAILQTFEMCE